MTNWNLALTIYFVEIKFTPHSGLGKHFFSKRQRNRKETKCYHISFPLNHFLPFPLYFSASLPFLSFSSDSTLKSCSICCTACPEARPPQICICICVWVLKPIYQIGPILFFCCHTLPSTWFYEWLIHLCDVRKYLFLAMYYACPNVLYFNLILMYGEDVLVRLYCHVLGGSHPIVVLVDLPPVATAEGESSSEKEEEEEEERPTNSRTSSTESSQLFSVFSTLSTRQPSTRQGKAGGGPGGQQLLLHCQQTCEGTT